MKEPPLRSCNTALCFISRVQLLKPCSPCGDDVRDTGPEGVVCRNRADSSCGEIAARVLTQTRACRKKVNKADETLTT